MNTSRTLHDFQVFHHKIYIIILALRLFQCLRGLKLKRLCLRRPTGLGTAQGERVPGGSHRRGLRTQKAQVDVRLALAWRLKRPVRKPPSLVVGFLRVAHQHRVVDHHRMVHLVAENNLSEATIVEICLTRHLTSGRIHREGTALDSEVHLHFAGPHLEGRVHSVDA